MATKTKEKANLMEALLGNTPRVLAQVKDEKSVYLGPCVVQAPGGWTRVGPTWQTPVGWVIVGPGIANWGTTQGLAELASASTAKPKLHALGVAVTPDPNIVYAMVPDAIPVIEGLDALIAGVREVTGHE